MSQGQVGCWVAASVPAGIFVLAFLWNGGSYLDPPNDPKAGFTEQIAECFENEGSSRGAGETLGRTMKQAAVGIAGLGVVVVCGFASLVRLVTSKKRDSSVGHYSE